MKKFFPLLLFYSLDYLYLVFQDVTFFIYILIIQHKILFIKKALKRSKILYKNLFNNLKKYKQNKEIIIKNYVNKNKKEMDTFEEDITNEKDLISKDDLEKTNSLAIKSLDESAFDFLEFLKEKYFLLITFNKSNNNIQINNKSIFKIFELFNNKKDKENFEEVLLNHITCTINEKDDFNTINQGIENSVEILDSPYIELLSNTNNYKINFNKKEENKIFEDIKKNLLIYEEQNNKLNINSKSIKKICKFLGKNIFDISDYINIIVLYLNEDEINKVFIQNKILDKYNKSEEKFYFLGNKKLETDLIIPEKNKKNSIYKLNFLFDKILNKIDNIENISDLSEDFQIKKNENENIPKKYIEQKIKVDSHNYDEIENNKSEDEEYDLSKDDKCNCQKDLCEFCNIF